MLRLIAPALLLLAAPALAQDAPPAPAPAAATDYANQANWLCLPGRPDACGAPLATTALNANGYGSVGRSVPDPAAKIDCFYVYPTVSRDPGGNSDLVPGLEEQAAAAIQLARFASICRPFAPIYRQLSLAALLGMSGGGGVQGDFGMAYGDVLAAWRDYLARHNQGRPFVLIGHSQGTIMLTKLLADEIEGKPEAARMLSALLIGYTIEVPEGAVVGGTFRHTPLCTKVGEIGCVVTYMSFRATNPPAPDALFGRARAPGMTAGCTNPARLARGSAPLDSYWFTALPGSDIIWSSGGRPPTPFVRTEGLASAACIHRGPAGYLAISVNADPADARTDRIPGDVVISGNVLAAWGLHTADVNLAQGDLIALVEAQAEAYLNRR